MRVACYKYQQLSEKTVCFSCTMNKSRTIILDRINPVAEALDASPSRIKKLYVQKGIGNRRILDIAERARRSGIPIVYFPENELRAMSSRHQGLAARIAPKELITVEKMLADSPCPFLLLLDGVEDPQNLGAVIRTAEGAGVDGLIIPERRSAGLTAAVYSVSAGALEHIAVSRIKNLARTMDYLKKQGVWLVGAEEGRSKSWYEFDYTGPVGLVLGSEGTGLRRLVREKCDCLLSLPLAGHVSSLNVSAAAAVFIFEVVRQRNQK
jgi:23S rRNA (guanosine2251-2'-O)-methyltransferase